MGLTMAAPDFILDTNAVIDLHKGLLAQPLPAGTFALSVITEIELRGFPGLTPDQEAVLTRFFAAVPVIGLLDTVKETAIQLRRGQRIKVPDAIIAATAIVCGAVLLTNDQGLTRINGLHCRALAVRTQA